MVNLSVFSVVDTGHNATKNLKNSYPFDFINKGGKNLVVTIGDSWTWGADMTFDDNNDHRLANNFGNHLSDNLDADWLSLGQGGSGNFWMYDRIGELARIIPEMTYDTIYVICTLTETGRAISDRRDIDFYNFFRENHPSELIKYLNNLCVDNIISLLSGFDNVVLRIGTNFVDYLGDDNKYLMPTPWLELMCKKYSINYTGNCQIVGPWVIDAFKQMINLVPEENHSDYLNLIDNLLDQALLRKHIIESVPDIYCYHPKALSHKLWADYILKSL